MKRPWGKWTKLWGDERVEVRLLEVKAGGFCTLHRHANMSNVFYVLEGSLRVDSYHAWPDDRRSSVTFEILEEQDVAVVSPPTVHRFQAISKVVALEFNIAVGSEPVDPLDSEQLGPAGLDNE